MKNIHSFFQTDREKNLASPPGARFEARGRPQARLRRRAKAPSARSPSVAVAGSGTEPVVT